jgi:hypothetical protein
MAMEGVGGGDHAGIFALLKVTWDVGLPVGAEVLGIVIELGERGEDAPAGKDRAGQRGVVGGGVYEGFEDRAGRAFGDGVIELGRAVVAAADEGENLAGVRVESDESHLGIGDSGVAFAVKLADQLVDVLHADFDGVGGGLLQGRIERGVDAQSGVGCV